MAETIEKLVMKKIYFLCIGNSARSQMAEGFAKTMGKNFFEVKSGGTKPASRVSSRAIKVMKEIDIDISNQKTKELDTSYAKKCDLVVIMGSNAENMCPAWILSKSENWNLADPKDQDLEFFRKQRDKIKAEIEKLIIKIKKGKI